MRIVAITSQNEVKRNSLEIIERNVTRLQLCNLNTAPSCIIMAAPMIVSDYSVLLLMYFRPPGSLNFATLQPLHPGDASAVSRTRMMGPNGRPGLKGQASPSYRVWRRQFVTAGK